MGVGGIAVERERLLRGKITGAMIRLAWPVFISVTLHTCFNIVNIFWVGRLGPQALAAVTTSLFATWSLWAVAEMVGVGIVAIVARHAGAGDRPRADAVAAQGILLAIALSFLVMATAPFAPRALFRLLGTDADVAREGTLFLKGLFYGSGSFFLLFTLESILRAWGDTKTPMRISALVVGANILLDPLLIFGFGPVPRMEVQGAAVATVAAHVAGVAIYAIHFHRNRHRFPGIAPALLRAQPRVVLKILRIGAPASLNMILFSIVYLFLSREAAAIGTAPLAGLGVGNRIESVSFTMAMSLAVASATMVGQNLGAGRIDRATAAAKTGAGLALGVCTGWGLVFFLLAEPILRLFTRDPGVVEAGRPFLQIIAVSQPLMGIEIALAGAFQGAGYTLAPMLVSSAISLLRIPLAHFAVRSLGMGFLGIPWVITTTAIVRGLILIGMLRHGRWTSAKVDD